jgi:uncharacterized phage protein (TIGR01671 family)
MRKIKFRAWDKEYKRMFNVVEINYNESETLICRKPYKNEKVNWITSGLVLGEECEIMQFTGLKDKNDKEIYEGDIVQTGYNGDTKGEVVFEYGVYLVKTNRSDMHFNHPEEYKVIGNIYENPELLKV